ncbi:MAG: glycosyltransferase family 2 protein [Deltaproteobacteria bacterium]|nr:MAG: glycosyltransferase family 2 protein [Deltaproteobacteria bacterium]
MPRVSIITPAYKVADLLAETAASVRAQTFADWEWVIAEDGSPDDTLAVAQALAAEDPRIRVLAPGSDTGSAAAARNRAMAVARGEFFAFLDADDVWLPEKLATQVALLDAHPEIGGVACRYEVFGYDGAERDNIRMQGPSGAVPYDEAVTRTPWLTTCFVMRRACYDELGGMDPDPRLRSGQDYEYWLRLLTRFTIWRTDEVLARWRQFPEHDSLSGTNREAGNPRGWRIQEVLVEKGLLDEEQQRVRRAFLHYEEARDAVLHHGGSFRRPLLRSFAEGRPPRRAYVMAALMWMPSPVLKRVLEGAARATR